MTLFRNKYRIESTRLPGYDYSSPGTYFVTLCTKDRICWFGEVVEGEMRLSPAGKIVSIEWLKTPNIRPEVSLDEWIVMPDHIHAIVIINGPVEADGRPPLRKTGNHFGPQRRNLASIIRGFKAAATKQIHLSGHLDFEWQRLFWDHIIDDEDDYWRVKNYIGENPRRWWLKRRGEND